MAGSTGSEIGRVETWDVMVREDELLFWVRLKLAGGTYAALAAPATGTLLRGFLEVWGADSLADTRGKLCWVTLREGALIRLAPLMPDEGDTLELSQPEEQTAPAAPEAPTPVQAQAERKAALAATWKEYMIRSRRCGADISAYRPKPGSSVEEIEQLLHLALTEIETAEEQARKAVAA